MKNKWIVEGGKNNEKLFESFAKIEKPSCLIDERIDENGICRLEDSKWNPFIFSCLDVDCETYKIFENIDKCQWLKLKLYNFNGDLLEEWKLKETNLANTKKYEWSEADTEPFDVEFTFEFKNLNYKINETI